MKKRIQKTAGLLLLLLFVFTCCVPVLADTVTQRLFVLKVSDGYTTQKIPIYEYNDNGTVTVGPAVTDAFVPISRVAAQIKIKRKSASAYYKANYEGASNPKKLKALNSQEMTGIVKAADGRELSYHLTFGKPEPPKILSLKVANGGGAAGGIITTAVTLQASESVTCKVKIRNASKKVVYTGTVGEGNLTSFFFYWDTKASAGNKAGYAPGDVVEAGKYKITAYISYQEGNKKKTLKKTVSFNVSEATVASMTLSGSAAAPIVLDNKWPWTMIVTGDKATDYLAEYICQRILNPQMTEYQRARAIHRYCVLHFSRSSHNTLSAAAGYPDKIDFTSDAAKEVIKKYGKRVKKMIAAGTAVIDNTDTRNLGSRISRMKTAMAKQTGDCLNVAYYMEALMRHAGLECDILENGLAQTHPLHHFFNTVKVDGKIYICDARIENARLQGTNVTFSHFLRGTKNITKISGDDIIRYGTISSNNNGAYKALFAKVSADDYPRP